MTQWIQFIQREFCICFWKTATPTAQWIKRKQVSLNCAQHSAPGQSSCTCALPLRHSPALEANFPSSLSQVFPWDCLSPFLLALHPCPAQPTLGQIFCDLQIKIFQVSRQTDMFFTGALQQLKLWLMLSVEAPEQELASRKGHKFKIQLWWPFEGCVFCEADTRIWPLLWVLYS